MMAHRTRATTSRILAVAVSAALLTLAGSNAAAQSKKLGAYQGTIAFSGTQTGPEVQYKASATVTMPVTSRSNTAVSAEFLAGEAPHGMVRLAQWDESHTNKFPDSDGRFSSYKCSLAAPVDVPVSVTGVLNVDLKGRKHALSVTVLSLKDVPFNCVHSRSGPYKRNSGISFSLGTGVPGDQDKNPQPFADLSRLAGKFTLDPSAYTQGKHGPIKQEWDFKLAP